MIRGLNFVVDKRQLSLWGTKQTSQQGHNLQTSRLHQIFQKSLSIIHESLRFYIFIYKGLCHLYVFVYLSMLRSHWVGKLITIPSVSSCFIIHHRVFPSTWFGLKTKSHWNCTTNNWMCNCLRVHVRTCTPSGTTYSTELHLFSNEGVSFRLRQYSK